MGERAHTQFEMFVYVDVDSAIADLDGISTVLREPADMPWGERVAYLTDPDDNPVALATTTSTSGS
jgi:lactoylglutathione lyase